MIKAVTSIADLIHKSKTQDPYKSLMILAVKGIFANNGQNRVIQSYEQALEALNEYTTGYTDCSQIVESINWYRHQITDPADVEFNNLFILKERQPRRADTAADNARPSYNGEYLTISGGGGYSRVAEEYERMRREATQNGYVVASQQAFARIAENRAETVSMAGTDYEILQRHYINPATGLRHTISRQIPLGIPQNIRNEIEEELRLDAEREIQRQITSSRRRNVSQFGDPEDFYSSYWDDDVPMRRRINEDNPNTDR